jgi:hypothetical protein
MLRVDDLAEEGGVELLAREPVDENAGDGGDCGRREVKCTLAAVSPLESGEEGARNEREPLLRKDADR